MSWVKLTDTALDDPGFLTLSRGARLLHLEALAFASRHTTDGLVPGHALSRLTDEPDAEVSADALVAAGLWERADSGWRLVWLQDDQPSAEDVARKRAVDAHRARRTRQHHAGDHSLCTDPRWCGWLRSQGTSDERHDERSPDVRTPDPTRPDQRSGTESGVRSGARRGSAGAPGAPGVAAGPEGAVRRCLATTSRRRPCSKFPLRGTDYCVSHRRHAAEAAQDAQREAKAAEGRRRRAEAAASRPPKPPVLCPECGAEYRTAGGLSSHVRARHPKPPPCEWSGCPEPRQGTGDYPRLCAAHEAEESRRREVERARWAELRAERERINADRRARGLPPLREIR
jgi:hypothetical protein